ncbi:OmpL47-type beta-barrel domain-containing protein [Neobacillus sp. SCS-31]|uniref:OmpL47-type beta-barrel domain-containing protein n=1 Tax=Neobacillus oceani TaxID=3115292 RepID=UPI0039066D7C
MGEKSSKIPVFLLTLILLYQLVLPFGDATAFANSSMLPPSNLAYQSITPDDGRLTWNTVFGATGYKVYEIKDGQIIPLGTTTSTSYSLNDQPEGVYRYVVSTVTTEGESGPSAPVSVEIVYPNMAAPAKVTSAIRNGNDISLSWEASQYATSYNVYRIDEAGEKKLLTATSSRSYTLAKAEEGNYVFVVSAFHNLYGESPTSDPVNVDLAYPIMEAPANLSFSVSNGTDVTLKWQASSYAVNYRVYEVLDGQKQLVNTVTNTSNTLKNVPSGEHTYLVHSYSDRFGESAEGSQVTLTVSTIVMQAPGNPSVKIQNINDATISWTSAAYATAYKVYQNVNGGRILKSTVTGTAVTYSKLPAGSYQYEVYSFSDKFGESETGTAVSFAIDAVQIQPPADLTYKVQNGNDFVLNWTAATNAENYNVYKIADGKRTLLRTVTGTTTTFTNQAAGEYTIAVTANSSRFGESAEGTTISFTLEQIILQAPQNLTYEIKNVNDVYFTWSPVVFAESYKVYQVVDGQKILKATVSNTSSTLTNLPEGVHNYRIYAYSSRFGESGEGTSATASINYPVMAAPQNPAVTMTSPTSFTLGWDLVDYATNYKVYQIVNGQKVLKNTVTGKTVSFSNMAPGTYSYEVYSYSTRFGESKIGTSFEAKVEEQALPAPETISFLVTNGNDITIKWSTVPYATGYKVYQVADGKETLIRTLTATSVNLTNLPEGEFTYRVRAYSTLLGDSPYSAEAKGTIIYPVMEKPSNVTASLSNGNDITIKWNTATYANSYKVYQVIDGGKVLLRTVTSTSLTLSNMPEGDYTYVVHSISDRFGESPEGSTVNSKIIFPVMQAPANFTQSITNGNDITLRWNAATYANGYRIYQIQNGDKSLVKTVTSTSTNFTNMPEGDYTYVIHSFSDRFGESPVGSSVGFNLAWPVVQAPKLSGSVFDANNITLSWPAVTWANEYRVYKVKGDNKELIYKGPALSYKVYNLTEETHSFEVTAYSTRFGESVPSNRVEQKIVYPIMGVPAASLKLLSQTSALITWDFVTYANGYNIYELIGEERVLVAGKINNLSYTLQNLTYANHQYVVTSYSNSFGESKPSEILLAKLIVDTTPPETAFDGPSGWSTENVTVTLHPNDDETGVKSTFYSLNDGPITAGTSILVTMEGYNKISYHSVDNAGNMEQVKTAYVWIDKTAPVTSISKIPDYAQSVTIELTGLDGLSNIGQTLYSINGSDFIEGTSFTVEKEGVNRIVYFSVDQAGNREDTKTAEVKIDKTAPITETSVPGSWVNENVTVTLKPVDEASGIKETFYSINGSDYIEGTSFTVEKEGVNRIAYFSVDQAGNREEPKTAEVKVDKTASITETSVPGSWVNENVTVTLKPVDEASGIKATFYSINGSDFIEDTSFTVEKEGVNEIAYFSVDKAGNREEANSVQIKIDKTAPVTTATLPAGWVKEDVFATLSSADNISKDLKTFYSIDGSDFVEGTSFKISKEGITKIAYYSVDEAKNAEEIKTTEVKIDKSAPEAAIITKTEYQLGSVITLDYTAFDGISEVASKELMVNGKTYSNGDRIKLDQPGEYKIQLSVTDAAGWTTIQEKTFTVYIPVSIEVLPKVITGNKGIFTIKADLTKELQSLNFDVKTVTLNGVYAKADNNGLQKQAEKGHFKFEREDFKWEKGEVTVELRGYLDNKYLVVANTTIKVK